MFREFLVNPSYKIYVFGDDGLVKRVYEKMKDPERPFYLGQSDDLIDVHSIELVEVKTTENTEISSVLKGIYENCEVIRLPYKFSPDGKVLEKITVSVPNNFPLKLKDEIECLLCKNEFICAY